VIREQMRSAVLLLIINNTPNARMILTGKFFEYLAAGRPILCIGPEDGDAAEIIRKTESGVVAGFGEEDRIFKHIINLHKAPKDKEAFTTKESTQQYSRKILTARLTGILSALEVS
jgi:hypothetical protein